MRAVLQRKPEIAEPAPEDLHEVGCVTRLSKMVKFPDGTARVLVEGLWRIRVKNFTPPAPYLRAAYDLLRDETENSVELQAMLRNAHKQFDEIAKMSAALPDQVKIAALNTDHPGHFADLIAANLNLSLEDRQRLLEIISVRERLQKLLPLLGREQEVLTLSSKIQNDVASSIAKNQRDFFLREQMRVIQRELGDTDPNANEIKTLREKIEQTPMPDEARKAAGQELERLQQTPPAAAEYGVARNYLDWILTLPWEKSTEDKLDLKAAEKILNDQHFGLGKVKDRLLEFHRRHQAAKTNQRADPLPRRPTRRRQNLPRQKRRRRAGPQIRPHLARRNAGRSRNSRPPPDLCRRDARTNHPNLAPRRKPQPGDSVRRIGQGRRGFSRRPGVGAARSSRPGAKQHVHRPLPRFAVRLVARAVHHHGELAGADSSPRCATGWKSSNCPVTPRSEKLQIAKRYLVPRQLEEHGLTKSDVKFTDSALRRLIREYTREAGVRQLEREIAALTRKATRKIISGNGAATTVKLDAGHLQDFLGHAPFIAESAEKITEIGIATGLAWTPVGGDILFIEATRMRGRGNLILTGSLGEVMKESAQTAVSYLRSQAKKLDLDFDDYGKHDLHIHVPAGATPKDGPSAGVAIVAALASLLSKRRVKSDVAMTGEISLRGRVLRVGGIKEKVLAAQRFGMKQVILPEGNKSDWLEAPAEVRSKLKAHFVRQISEVLQLALAPK